LIYDGRALAGDDAGATLYRPHSLPLTAPIHDWPSAGDCRYCPRALLQPTNLCMPLSARNGDNTGMIITALADCIAHHFAMAR